MLSIIYPQECASLARSVRSGAGQTSLEHSTHLIYLLQSKVLRYFFLFISCSGGRAFLHALIDNQSGLPDALIDLTPALAERLGWGLGLKMWNQKREH